MNHNAFTKILTNKDARNEAEYEEYSVTDEVPSYFNIFECGRNILNRLDVTYEQAGMATKKDKYFEKLLEILVDHNAYHNAPLSNEYIRQAVSKFTTKTEEEEFNANNVTMDTF